MRLDRDPDRIDKYVSDDYVFELHEDMSIAVYQIGSRIYIDKLVRDESDTFQEACHVWLATED